MSLNECVAASAELVSVATVYENLTSAINFQRDLWGLRIYSWRSLLELTLVFGSSISPVNRIPSLPSCLSWCTVSHTPPPTLPPPSTDVSHCSPLFSPLLHLPPLSSHTVYSCQTPLSFIFLSLYSSHSVTLSTSVSLFIFSFSPNFFFLFFFNRLSFCIYQSSSRPLPLCSICGLQQSVVTHVRLSIQTSLCFSPLTEFELSLKLLKLI